MLQKNILRYLSLKFSCDQIIKTTGLILGYDMFGVTIVLFFFCCKLVNMCKDLNELLRKQQIRRHMS